MRKHSLCNQKADIPTTLFNAIAKEIQAISQLGNTEELKANFIEKKNENSEGAQFDADKNKMVFTKPTLGAFWGFVYLTLLNLIETGLISAWCLLIAANKINLALS